jgi:hypothetical protein
MTEWIDWLSDYWITRSNIQNNVHNVPIKTINQVLKNSGISCHNFSIMKGTFNKGTFIFEFDRNRALVNIDCIRRLRWYEDFFKDMNDTNYLVEEPHAPDREKEYLVDPPHVPQRETKYSFSFLFNHLDCFPKFDIVSDMRMISFGCSAPNILLSVRKRVAKPQDILAEPKEATYNCIPIIDAHHLWHSKRTTVYNVHHDLRFDKTPFRDKIGIVVWRGGPIPTFAKTDLTLLHFRGDVWEKYRDNPNFNVQFTNNFTFMFMTDMSKYKYILNIDGHGASFDGTVWKMRSTSLVIWITGEDDQLHWLLWYTPLFKPYVHYVPSSVQNLQKTFEWCEENQDKCEQMILESTRLMEDILENTTQYHRRLFDKLNDIYTENKT